jgi:hypothetical protein
MTAVHILKKGAKERPLRFRPMGSLPITSVIPTPPSCGNHVILNRAENR